MSGEVTVAIPTLDAGPRFAEVLAAVRSQVVDRDVHLLICDSGSRDETVAIARRHDAEVIAIPRARFGHGTTRNLLASRGRGDHIVFLTQDATPATTDWLARLLDGFTLAPDVGLAFGPYRPRPDAAPSVVRELTTWFQSLAPDGRPRVDRLPPAERDLPARRFVGHLGYFTDANGALARAAWERVPFRDTAYAEDHLLAQDMLRAGYAKAFVPSAAVIHSHDYSAREWLRRSFDESRALHDVYGWVPGAEPRAAARNLRGNVGADWRASGHAPAVLAGSLIHHTARTIGTVLGAWADLLPASLTRRLSLERRPR